MSGYKRVNFYELCRLCASNQQKEKTHIFQEEGRKIQLQFKIQSCLSLKVCENDFLPKVVCSQCLQSLEDSYVFRKDCYSSETMLSSYFNNFRQTEDFKRSGKVYIKDTSPKTVEITTPPKAETSLQTKSSPLNVNVVQNINAAITQEAGLPYYTLLPTIVTNDVKPRATQLEQQQKAAGVAYNLNTINLASIKNVLPAISPTKANIADTFGNVAVNSNGEIIGITSLVDLDTYIKMPKRTAANKTIKVEKNLDNPGIIKIDLTHPDPAEIKSKPHLQPQTKLTYAVKVEEIKQPAVLNSSYDTSPHSVITQQAITNHVNTGNANIISIANINVGHLDGIRNAKVYQPPQQPITTNYTISNNQYKRAVINDPNSLSGHNIYTTNYTQLEPVAESKPTGTATPVINHSSVAVTMASGGSTFVGAEDQPPLSPPMTKVHSCDVCQKSFKRREHLYQHMKLHTGFRPFRCEHCNKAFMRKEHLLRHMTSHSGQKNFMCNICEKSFSRNDNLLKHKKIHSKQSSFTCEICQKQFVMEHYYMAHKLTHDSEKVEGVGGQQLWGMLKAA